jgi:hypothetical protein
VNFPLKVDASARFTSTCLFFMTEATTSTVGGALNSKGSFIFISTGLPDELTGVHISRPQAIGDEPTDNRRLSFSPKLPTSVLLCPL